MSERATNRKREKRERDDVALGSFGSWLEFVRLFDPLLLCFTCLLANFVRKQKAKQELIRKNAGVTGGVIGGSLCHSQVSLVRSITFVCVVLKIQQQQRQNETGGCDKRGTKGAKFRKYSRKVTLDSLVNKLDKQLHIHRRFIAIGNNHIGHCVIIE